MGENRVAEDVASLGKGFVSAFSQISSKDEDESFAQRFDDDGRKSGGVIRLLPPQPLFTLNSLAVVGLASGGFVALGLLDNEGFNFTGDVVAQAFSRSGAKVSKLKTLTKSVPTQPVTGAAVSLPDGGFPLALEEGKPFGKVRLTFTRYDDGLSPDG